MFGRWLEETHSPRFELCRHFLLRFFDSELISDPSQARVVAGGAIGILVSISLLFGQAYYHKYRMLLTLDSPEPFHHAERGDVLFLVTLIMTAAALFTVLEWPALFPGLRDYLALAALPVRMSEIFIAKFFSLIAVAFAVIVAAALPPSILIPAMMTGRYAGGAGWHVPGMFLASLAGGCFVFFTLVAVQGVLLNLAPVRLFPRISLALQGILLAILLGGIPFVFSIPTLYNRVTTLPAWAIYAPPCWFYAIDQLLFGARDAMLFRLARIAVLSLAGSAAAALAAYLWSYRRHRIRVIESPGAEAAAARLVWPARFTDRLLDSPRTIGVFAFIAKSLARSRQHRLILIAFGAVAVALIAQGFSGILLDQAPAATGAMRQAIVSIPLALSLILLAGLRYLFRLPVELRANWIFRITEPGHSAELARGVERFLLYWGALPVAVLTLPAEMSLLGARGGLAVTLLALLLSLLVLEVLLFPFERIPFTSSYLPGRRPLMETVIVASTVGITYIWGLATALSALSRSPAATLVAASMLLALWWKLRRARLDSRRMLRFEFEESPEPAVLRLNIERE